MTTTTNENLSNYKAPKRSVSTIVGDKLLDVIQNASISTIINRVMLALSALVMWLGVAYPEVIIEWIKIVATWDWFAIPKLIFCFVIVFNYKSIIEFIKDNIPSFEKEEVDQDTIEWIPMIELLDHLFEFKSFKRDDVEQKFAIPRHRFTDLANKFEEMWILVRGINNSRVLNNDFSRQDIASILSGKSTTQEIKPVFRKSKELSPSSLSVRWSRKNGQQ